MLIDCHTHAFADKIASKAVEQLINYYKLPTNYGGDLSALLEQAHLAHLDALIMLVAATKPEQVRPAHDWILSLPDEILSETPKIFRFGTYHIDDPDWKSEIDRLRAVGIKGVKLHPEFQGIDLADPRLEPLFEEIAGEFILMVHVGDPHVSQQNMSTPRKVAAILKKFPRLTIIAAHLGGYCFWDDVITDLAGKNLFLDTSSASAYINEEKFRRIVSLHGTEKILMGSDYPLRSPVQELETLDAISWLTTAQKTAIAGENCAHLLGLR